MFLDIPIRLRRNRKSQAIRNIVQETALRPADFVVPFFVIEGEKKKEEISSMPGVYRYSVDELVKRAVQIHAQGVQSVVLFPVVDSALRSPSAEEAWNRDGLLFRAISTLKNSVPELCIMADVALDPFTSHGHDGLADEQGEILNDATIECLVKMALIQAEAGIDFVAPSDMMDGRIGVIRSELDRAGFSSVGIMAYSVKYASALYGPFRNALNTRLLFGDKRTYQMDPANVREALLEAQLDEEEGADILMVKPALFYLDVIAKLRECSHRPIAAYHVSGEYAMVMAAHEKGWLDADKVFFEALLSIKRAGAAIIFSYAAERLLKFF